MIPRALASWVASARAVSHPLQLDMRQVLKGRPFSVYLYLSHETGERSAKTVPSPDGLLVVDYAANGQPIGVEITAPLAVSLERLNRTPGAIGDHSPPRR